MLVTFKSIEKENKKRLLVVAHVIEATLASITGKIETKARFLAMRPQVCWRPNTTIKGSLIRFNYAWIKANASFKCTRLRSFPNNSKLVFNSGPCIEPVDAIRIGINRFLPFTPVSF